jgi:antitoxin (DNA-binding transcriptional repressor) of toxin-antitoxin stability system
MIVSSTEFQQNVGHYLKLAEAGSPIQITKSKPKYSVFKLVFQKNRKAKKNKTSKQIAIELMEKYAVSRKGESGLEFQNRVRS